MSIPIVFAPKWLIRPVSPSRLSTTTSLVFCSADYFREFCRLGDIDPYEGAVQYEPWPSPKDPKASKRWMFASRARDVIFETDCLNPNLENTDGCVDIFGITGQRDKVERMYEFVRQSAYILWDDLYWGERYFI